VDAVTPESAAKVKTWASGLAASGIVFIAGQGVVSCRASQERDRSVDKQLIELTGLAAGTRQSMDEQRKVVETLRTDVAILKDRAERRP
jgi:hypothetical protein